MSIALVDLAALAHNLGVIQLYLQPGSAILAPVKANAYGHGAVRIARELEGLGVDWFGVSTPEELLELRTGGVSGNILLLTPALERLKELADADAVFTVCDHASLDRLLAAQLPAGTRVHLKADTGTGRLGLPVPEAAVLAERIASAGNLVLEGVYTHFASAEEADRSLTERQLNLFSELLDQLQQRGIEPTLRHCSNSAALVGFPAAGFDLVRPGIALYGYPPAAGLPPPDLRPLLTLLAPVLMLKRVAAGTGISYNHLWQAPRDTNIATIRCGYADGYRRTLGNDAWASLNGQRVDVVGQVAMDQLLLDTGAVEAEPGQLVTLLGGTGPGADELGRLCGTNAYDLLVSLSARVLRQYVYGTQA